MKLIHNKDEKELVKECCAGDAKAQYGLYQRYSRKMFGVCLGYAKDYDTAKDLLQEGFIKVFQNLNKYDGTGSLEGWIRRTIVNNNIDYFRKEARRGSYFTLEEEHMNFDESDVPSIKNEALRAIEVEEFLRMTRLLPEGYRLILNLHVVEGLTHAEIAARLEIKEGTSKSQFSKAKKFLYRHLTEYFDAEIISSYEKRTS